MTKKNKIITVKPREKTSIGSSFKEHLNEALKNEEFKNAWENEIEIEKTHRLLYEASKEPPQIIQGSNDGKTWVDLKGMMRMADFKEVRLKPREENHE